MIHAVVLPEISENVESGEVSKYLVSVGDEVKVDQPVVEMETDKAVVEIPSPFAGRVVEIKFREGDAVHIGEVLLTIEAVGEADESISADPDKAPAQPEESPIRKPAEVPVSTGVVPAVKAAVASPDLSPQAGPVPAAPSVRRFAREIGVDINEITGTGTGGRISMDDVKTHAKHLLTAPKSFIASLPSSRPLPDFTRWGEIEIKPMSKIRRITADGLAYSWTSIPHVTQVDVADVTQVEDFRNRNSKKVQEAGGKLTLTAILLKILAKALQRFPQFNTSLDIEAMRIIYKKYYHIGVAVDTDRGLLVPVVRDVDRKNLTRIAVELSDLADRTRRRKIMPEEMEGGTFTISNLGGIGGVAFTPIVYPPQVAIIGVARASVQPVFDDGEWIPRLQLPLTLSYDHRIIDGADGARFLAWIVKALEQPLEMFL